MLPTSDSYSSAGTHGHTLWRFGRLRGFILQMQGRACDRDNGGTSSTLGCVLSLIIACRYTAFGLMLKRCRRYSPMKATMAAERDCIGHHKMSAVYMHVSSILDQTCGGLHCTPHANMTSLLCVTHQEAKLCHSF
jgi:hypothetical protein